MTGENGMAGETPKPARKPRFRMLTGPKLSNDQLKRQGEVAHFAFLALGGRDRAVAFLNGHDAALGGRPLDIALASAEGAARVIDMIGRLGPDPAESPPRGE